MKINTRWFRDQLDNLKITQRELARQLDLDPAGVSYMLRGRRQMRPSEIAHLANLFNVPIEEVYLQAGLEPPRRPVSNGGEPVMVTGTVEAATGEINELKGGKIRRAPALPTPLPKGAVGLRIQGDGPEAGWVLYYVPKEAVEAGAVGQLAVVTLPGKRGQYVRVLERGDEPGSFHLRAWPRGRDLENARVLAANPVLAIKP